MKTGGESVSTRTSRFCCLFVASETRVQIGRKCTRGRNASWDFRLTKTQISTTEQKRGDILMLLQCLLMYVHAANMAADFNFIFSIIIQWGFSFRSHVKAFHFILFLSYLDGIQSLFLCSLNVYFPLL